jgi:hypothetical protein
LGDVIEYDPSAPQAYGPQVSPQAVETNDTISVPQEFFDARDEILDRLTGPKAMAAAQAAIGPDQRKSRVLGVGIGFQRVGGTMTGEVAVQVLVEAKLPMSVVDPALAVPSSVGNLVTDVEEVGGIHPHAFSSRFQRPVPCGVSVGHVDITAGTIGCLVVLNNNRLCILSNNHVLANSNKGKPGDFILQPGVVDGGQSPADVIATLENFVTLNPGAPNLVDAAVAFTAFELVSPNHVTYKVNPTPVAAALGLSVMKNGRTTDSTIGMITGIGFSGVQVGYSGVGTCSFQDQIVVSGIDGPFSRPGDSGSLIVTVNTKQPVGLLFAGSVDNSKTFGNPIAAVMQALGIRQIVGGE